MDEKGLFLKFWLKEGETMRKVISRVPEGSTYRPDPKSRTAREIAWLIAREEAVLADGLSKGVLDWKEEEPPATIKEILAYYDRHHTEASQALQALEPAKWERDMPFMFGGHEAFRATGYEHAWITLFDQVHHRGQLSTYLRAMGSTVPQIYGPSADEPM
jgi:uncharacterized damage-inducible protein DinB